MKIHSIIAGVAGAMAGILLAVGSAALAQGYPYDFGSPSSTAPTITMPQTDSASSSDASTTAPQTGAAGSTTTPGASADTVPGTAQPGTASANSLPSAALGSNAAVMQAASTYPMPMVARIDGAGNALIRGVVQSATSNTLTIASWGGTWTVMTNGATQVAPAGGLSGDVSAIPAGDFVGVAGTMDTTQNFLVNAVVVRDWSKTGAAQTTTGAAPAAGETGSGASSSNAGASAAGGGNSAAAPNGNASSSGEALYAGTVESVDAANGTLQFMDDAGNSYTVNAGQNTLVWNAAQQNISLGSIQPGDSVRFNGTMNASGSLDASVVRDTSQ